MSLLGQQNVWGWRWDNLSTTDTPLTAATSGVQLTAGNGAKGDYVNISTTNKYGAGSVTTLAKAAYLVEIFLHSQSASGMSSLVDIAIDTAGGTSYALFASNLIGAGAYAGSGAGIISPNRYVLPVYIPAGSSVAARVGSSTNAGTLYCAARYYGAPSRPDAIWTGSVCESVGVANDGSYPTNGDATAITPGDSGTWSSWTSLGNTVKRLQYINLGYQVRDATMTALTYYFEVGYGDATAPTQVLDRLLAQTNASENSYRSVDWGAPCDIPAGSTIYVRATCSGTNADSNKTVAVCGVA